MRVSPPALQFAELQLERRWRQHYLDAMARPDTRGDRIAVIGVARALRHSILLLSICGQRFNLTVERRWGRPLVLGYIPPNEYVSLRPAMQGMC